MTHTPTQPVFITLADTGEHLTVAAQDWREALRSMNRFDAIAVVPYPYIERGELQEGFAACRLISLDPVPFPTLMVAKSASTALDAALTALRSEVVS